MTDNTAPERIWAKPGMPGYISDGPNEGVYDVEYIRADLHAARVAELEAERDAALEEVARLREAVADTPEPSRIEELEDQAERDTDRIAMLSGQVELLREALGRLCYLQSGGPATGLQAEAWLKDARAAMQEGGD